MRLRRYALAGVLLGAVSGPVWAQSPAPQLHQPDSIRQTAFEYDSYLNFQEPSSPSPSDVLPDDKGMVVEPATPMPPAEQPAGPPPAPAAPPAAAEQPVLQQQAPPAPVCSGPECTDECLVCPPQQGCGTDNGCGNGCKPLFELGGWLEAGYTYNAMDPADRFNGPVTFNDRADELMMNQLYLFAERVADTSDRDWDWGFRGDVVYGTDGRYLQAAGLETEWDQTARFYQLATPQFYADLAVGDWLFRAGHFYTPMGYESPMAPPNNFFYSHSYHFQYAEPFTHTGVTATWQMTDRFSMMAGLHTGADQFDFADGKEAVNFLGGMTWLSPEELLKVAFYIDAQDLGPGVDLTLYSLVATLTLTENLDYVLQHDWGQQYDGNTLTKADWYGINQYLLYEINDAWSAGLRAEWFRDEDGARVTGLGNGNAIAGAFFPGDFYEVSAGLNWRPFERLLVRPELRYDWYEPRTPVAVEPYDAGNRDDQFLLGCDAILTF